MICLYFSPFSTTYISPLINQYNNQLFETITQLFTSISIHHLQKTPCPLCLSQDPHKLTFLSPCITRGNVDICGICGCCIPAISTRDLSAGMTRPACDQDYSPNQSYCIHLSGTIQINFAPNNYFFYDEKQLKRWKQLILSI